MTSTVARVLVAGWVVLLLGCGDSAEMEPEPEVHVAPGDYETETYNLLTNTCGSSDSPLGSIRITADEDPDALTFPDLTLGGESVPTAAATATDGVFTLKISVPLTVVAYDENTGDAIDCLLNDSLEIHVSAVDSESLAIDMGELRLEPIAGAVGPCTEEVGYSLSLPAYDHGAGCSVSFTSTMKRVHETF